MTRTAYKIEPGWACRAKPGSGVGDVPPRPGAVFPHFVTPPDPLRLLWRIVLRRGTQKFSRDQGRGGVALQAGLVTHEGPNAPRHATLKQLAFDVSGGAMDSNTP